MHKQKPTAGQIELLMSDWLANLREQGSFVHKNDKGAIRRKKTDNYSDYFTKGMSLTSMLDVLRNAREIAQGTVDSMTSVPVRVVLGGDGSATDGKTIVIATDYFDREDLSIGDKIDILTGYSVHEAAHINLTDMESTPEFIGSFPPAERETAMAVLNILEDERIEYLTGEERPGLMDFVATVKDFLWRRYEQAGSVNEKVTEPLPRFINTLLSAVRSPSMLTEEMVTENFQELMAIRKVLMPYPLSVEGVRIATKKIMEIMKDMVRKDLEEKQQQQNSQSQDGQQGQPGQGQGSPNGSPQKKPTAKEVNEAMKSALSSKQMQETLKAVNAAAPEQAQGTKDKAECLRTNNDGDKKYVDGDAEKITATGAGTGSISYMIRPKGNQTKYSRSYARIKSHVAAIRKALICHSQTREYELRGERNGRLDTNKLTSLRQGNRNIFTRQGEVTCEKASICILIDESGSMRGSRIEAARETAILIREAVKTIESLDLFIYGFGGNEMHLYQEGRKADRYALGSLVADGGTPTGEAMQIAYRKMARHSYPASLMLVITDGDPDRNSAVIEADAMLRKKGVIPVGIGIAGCRAVTRIFKENVVIDDLSQLAPQLGKITKKRLTKMMERHDSLA